MKIKATTNTVVLLFVLISISCKKEIPVEIQNEQGTVTDVDGNIYKTVKIGEQWWMAENLNVKSYNDGTPILEVSPLENDSTWSANTEGAMCRNDIRYGLLYNWFAITSTKKIAPIGWHIPTDDEWKTLERELGMSESESDKTAWRGSDEAEQLIIKSSVGWPSESAAFGTNKSGFTALPGGCRLFNGSSNTNSNTAFWWTSTEMDGNGWYRYLDYKKKTVFRSKTFKNYGLSIRCVKD